MMKFKPGQPLAGRSPPLGASLIAASVLAFGASGATAQSMSHDHGAMHGAMPATPSEAVPPPTPAPVSATPLHSSMHGAPSAEPAAAHAAQKTSETPAAMDHGDMQGGHPPVDARDPDAYANGHERGAGEHVPPGVSKLHLGDEHSFASFRLNRLERVLPRRGDNHTAFEGQVKFGGDFDHVVLKVEGEVAGGKLHEARSELLWGHAIAAYWDTQLGLRHDGGEGPDRTWLAFGVEGTAPYWIHARATGYLGQSGRTALRLEAEYDAHITQKLVLQPKTEWNFYGRNDRERGIGKGLSSASLGLRLRYEFTPQIAPYVGVEWQRRFGRTADFSRAAGGGTSRTRWVAGLSFWF